MCPLSRCIWRASFDGEIAETEQRAVIGTIVEDIQTLTAAEVETLDGAHSPLVVNVGMPGNAARSLQRKVDAGEVSKLGGLRIVDASILPLSDDQLLKQWREHDDNAAGQELLQRHYDAIYEFFASKVSGDIADLVQETFLACVKKRESYAGLRNARFKTWLFGIARFKLIEHYRKSKKLRSHIAPVDPNEMTGRDLGAGPSTWLREKFDQGLLRVALEHIKLRDRLLIELYLQEEFAFGEIAKIIEIPENTVRSQLRRAKSELEKQVHKIAKGQVLKEALRSIDSWPDIDGPEGAADARGLIERLRDDTDG